MGKLALFYLHMYETDDFLCKTSKQPHRMYRRNSPSLIFERSNNYTQKKMAYTQYLTVCQYRISYWID